MPSHTETERAKRDAEKAQLLGKGQARGAAEAVIERKERTRRALEAATKALGIRRDRQTTDSNN